MKDSLYLKHLEFKAHLGGNRQCVGQKKDIIRQSERLVEGEVPSGLLGGESPPSISIEN